MYSRVNYTIVGIFVLLFGIGMVWFAFWLAKYSLKEEYSTYRLYMKESVSGLSKDSSVKLHGVDVGRVVMIKIDPNNIEQVEITVDIKHSIPIKEDMFATTQMMGVTGLLSIEITEGSNSAKTLVATESFMPIIQTKPSLLSTLSNSFGTLSEKMEGVLDKGQELLSDKNIDALSKILLNVERVTAKGEALEDELLASIQEFRTSMKHIDVKFTEATKDFKQMQEDFSDIKDVTIPTINKMKQTSKNFNRATLRFEKSIKRGDYNVKKILEPLIVDVGILSEQMSDLAKELKQSPSDLLFKSRKQRRGPGE
ncbi:MAG: MlaD family protein [Campylobacterota bacterium]|nr:MlaD family protein [Campylobacterota bacterium]